MNWGDFWDQAAQWAITWIPVLGPLGILTTAVVAYVAYRQKLEADRRAQWWVRAQWALEASVSANPRRSLAGLAVLNDLKTSSLATREDRALFRLIGLTVQEEVLGDGGQPAAVRPLGNPAADDGSRADPAAPLNAQARNSRTRHSHADAVAAGSGLTNRILEQAEELLAGSDMATGEENPPVGEGPEGALPQAVQDTREAPGSPPAASRPDRPLRRGTGPHSG
ncbi:hypothetical protein H9639_14075 [Arthrobacter sp. Sa2CUA1]|uniref:DUF4381 domain-containing protein n=1 Tax=Arthrobacter gallicola TaxID=2762225 RepID=A0ABR8UV40_9MICC|nr:hypothetical protein [Arthrobacter gallicola]MBD7996425.1 hypothetical protein [Arthrobacter gallicola]